MTAKTTSEAYCEHCRFRRYDPRVTERRVPGLTSFGSAYGASIATSALCERHDCWVSPRDTCRAFKPVEG